MQLSRTQTHTRARSSTYAFAELQWHVVSYTTTETKTGFDLCPCECAKLHFEREALWLTRLSPSFRSWLVWKVTSSSLRRLKLYFRYYLTPTYSFIHSFIHSARCWLRRRRLRFFALLCFLLREAVWDIEVTSIDRYCECERGLSNGTKLSPQFDPLPIWGRRHEHLGTNSEG